MDMLSKYKEHLESLQARSRRKRQTRRVCPEPAEVISPPEPDLDQSRTFLLPKPEASAPTPAARELAPETQSVQKLVNIKEIMQRLTKTEV
ncbi:virion core protein [Nile crocodilepox virus]|uniref:Virion core protein n=1 Tax=Nile crocodilepox virus (isolate Crocodylus niloticus/Zimbabwe/Ume/2001) TaxID=1289473 RepID=Q070C6_CPRVZ|nr:virion core protein [Nile crocodilepox virus]ABJ09016.1 virion core protein [Nile crocodilepox virus]